MASQSVSTFQMPAPFLVTAVGAAAFAWWATAAQQRESVFANSNIPAKAAAPFKASQTIVPDWLEFQSLVSGWHSERGISSSLGDIALCPSYQRIIAWGPGVLPLIFKQLLIEGQEPDFWFWALHVLTNADPVPDAARGDLQAMAHAWLAWGRAHGHV